MTYKVGLQFLPPRVATGFDGDSRVLPTGLTLDHFLVTTGMRSLG